MARGKPTPADQQQSDRIAVNLDTATKKAFSEAAAADGVPEVSVWLKNLARRRMARRAAGARSIGELRKERDTIIAMILKLFSELETEDELEQIAAVDAATPKKRAPR